MLAQLTDAASAVLFNDLERFSRSGGGQQLSQQG
jgi:hypothetical protein